MDGSSYVKYNLPMSSAVTMLALGGIYYKSSYEKAQLYNKLLETIQWPLDYFIKCYINKNLVYAQCGSGSEDLKDFNRPEDSTVKRVCYKLTK